MPIPPLLTPGVNCWKVSRARRAGFLVDAADYYRAFAEAAERARSQIVITAWDIDGRIRLLPDRSDERLRDFFFRLLAARPGLQIYVLNWKYFISYANDRELLPSRDEPWRRHPRLHFEWDASHPLGACHHQKVVVIDNRLAFVGGLDFTHERWDTPRHDPRDPHRRNSFGEPYKPFHDVTMMVEGDAARDLGRLARRRWKLCAGRHPGSSPHLVVDPGSDPWPPSFPADLGAVPMAISRTEPRYRRDPEIDEIETLHRDMIRAAKRFVYIENQYFTAGRIRESIAERLRRRDSPEFVIILPKSSTGWLEEMSLGISRSRTIRRLRAHDRYGRLHVYYPYIAGLPSQHYIKVHSKLMIVDDLYLQAGSANLCNRSMGVDTECDVALENPPGGVEIREALRTLRERLLAEHVGVLPRQVRETFDRTGSLAATIAELSRHRRRLVPFSGEVSPWAEALDIHITALDPARPLL
jgi:phosphatidylserine/phosphatidylglycerophosphate/cardiolipin synthase-like enzyme